MLVGAKFWACILCVCVCARGLVPAYVYVAVCAYLHA
jgi:hypothetical protein